MALNPRTMIVLGLAPFLLPGSWSQKSVDSPPTWIKDIAPMFASHCSECHWKRGSGPFPLLTYKDVFRRRELVRTNVLRKGMPPCISKSDYGEFNTAPELSDEQLVTLQKWLQAGAPLGDGAETEFIPPPKWRLGEPSIIVSSSGLVKVPIEGNGVWRSYVVDPGMSRPFKLRAFDIATTSPNVVRHVLVGIARAGLKALDNWESFGTLDEKADRLIGSWAPGYRAWSLPTDVALTIDPGELLVVQALVMPTGKNEDVEIEIGLYQSNAPDPVEARWISLQQRSFELKPYDSRVVSLVTFLDQDLRIISIVPEARFFAFAIQSIVVDDRQESVLFETSKWSPYWTGNFQFAEPPILKRGTRIETRFMFENEEHSPINEGKSPKLVVTGPRITDEVCRAHFLVADPPTGSGR